jgi:hypothetical protein
MARCVTGLFEHKEQIDSVIGALRDAGFTNEAITVVVPGEAAATTEAPARRTVGGWLVEHLVHRGLPHEKARQYQQDITEGRHLVNVTVTTDTEDSDARNLIVTAGATEISSASDGKFVPVTRPPDGVTR